MSVDITGDFEISCMQCSRQGVSYTRTDMYEMCYPILPTACMNESTLFL